MSSGNSSDSDSSQLRAVLALSAREAATEAADRRRIAAARRSSSSEAIVISDSDDEPTPPTRQRIAQSLATMPPAAAASSTPAAAASASPTSSPPAAAAAADSSASVVLHDRLRGAFSGDALAELEELGVSAFDSAEVERDLLAQAIQADEQQRVDKAARLQAAIAASAAATSAAAATGAPMRRMIPKKSADRLALEAERAPLPMRPRERIVHPNETAPKKFRATTKKAADKPGATTGRGGGESIFDRASAAGAGSTKSEEARRERQRLIDTGEVTPFSRGGAEKAFARVQTTRIGGASASSAAAASSNFAAASPSAATASPSPKVRAPAAALGLSSPFPSASHPSASRPVSIPRKSSVPAAASRPRSLAKSKPAPSPERPTKRRRPLTSSDEDNSVAGSDADVKMEDAPSSVRVKKEYQPWTCEQCTFLNPTDFVARCGMCHTVRIGGDAPAATPSAAPRVKREPGTSPSPSKPSRSKYVEHDSDDDEAPAAARTKSAKRKRPVKAEDDEFETGEVSSSSSEDDAVDSALKCEDELLAAEDDEEDVDEEAALDAVEAARRRARFLHDGYDEWRYEERVEAFRAHQAQEARLQGDPADDPNASLDVAFDGGFILPAYIWNKLFAYQKTCIKWLWELHAQKVGGIIADEMGLGKTIQVIAFLAGMHYSAAHHALGGGTSTAEQFRGIGPTLIVVPATIMAQWLREFHEWYPELRVFVLHDSVPHGSGVTRRDIVHRVFERGGVLITTYQTVRTCAHLLLPREWGYVVLDEGHKIRNPDAAVTLCVKQVLSIHRLVLTGSPIQNSLGELWSLFDFVFPGKLGTLPIFEDEFCSPILIGGYTTATPVQVQLAYKCALVLRDLIDPYILRRSKADVAQHLPPKTEQVLFCNLTPQQHDIYRRFLDTHAKDISEIMEGKLSLFRVIHFLRKIANHADLLQLKIKGSEKKGRRGRDDFVPEGPGAAGPDYGSVDRSGKLQVVAQVLRMWQTQGHRCLIFSQTRQMLDIIEKFVRGAGYNYRRIDGATSIKARLPLIDQFNHDESIFVMLLTTRAGGLGVNLVGADRVILYDPDWNPATDQQARERAYRIGQQRPVTVYRLITRGCIEEKVYHRQVWKQFLTDKVMRDPKQKRFFSNHDIKDLFSLAPLAHGGAGSGRAARTSAAHNETASIFKGAGGEIDQESVITAERERMFQEEVTRLQKQIKLEEAAAATELEEGELPPDEPMLPSSSPVQVPSTSPPANKRLPSVKAESKMQTDGDDPPLDIVAYDSGAEDTAAAAANDGRAQSSADDNRILAALFSRSGIQSAMDHDAILGAGSHQERAVVADVANKVAQRAVQALRRSRQAMRDAPVNAPTWTGRSGVTGAPRGLGGPDTEVEAPRPRFGATTRRPVSGPSATAAAGPTDRALADARLRPATFGPTSALDSTGEHKHFDSSVSGFSTTSSAAPGGGALGSSALLARMRARTAVSSAEATPGPAAAPPAPSTPSSRLAASLRSVLSAHAHTGGLTSGELVSRFAGDIGDLELDKLAFRQLLRSVATLQPAVRGEKRWKLNSEFE